MITNPLHRIPTRTLLALILAISVLLRLGVALYHGNSFDDIRGGTHDQISYDALGQRVASGHGFTFEGDWWPYAKAEQPTAFWSYLYTGYLAVIYWLVGHLPVVPRMLQALLVGLLMPLLLYRIGTRTFTRSVGLIAAAVVAVYLYFVQYGAALMTEAFYITTILWTFDIVTRLLETLKYPAAPGASDRAGHLVWHGLELGLAMGLALLLRQVILFFWIAMGLWLLWVAAHSRRLRSVLTPLVVAVVIVAALMAPWMWRNYRVFGQLGLPNTNAGFAFFWANHPVYGTDFEAVLSPGHGTSYQALIPEELRSLNEAELDRALLRRGLAFVVEDPVRYLRLSLSRIPVFFQFWPTPESSLLSNAARVLSFGLFLPFMLYGLVLAARRTAARQSTAAPAGTAAVDRPSSVVLRPVLLTSISPVGLAILFIVLYTSIHLASWANVRYRLPVDAVLILFAAYGIDDLLVRTRSVWSPLVQRVLPAGLTQGAGLALG